MVGNCIATNILQLNTANFLYMYIFNPFEMAVQFFRLLSSFPNFDANAFFPNSTGPWPDFRKVGKSLEHSSDLLF